MIEFEQTFLRLIFDSSGRFYSGPKAAAGRRRQGCRPDVESISTGHK
jgi:hypothetical protein